MLTDASLTNILVVSGVSQIRYRVYHQRCNKADIIHHLKNTPLSSSHLLLKAYSELLGTSIPVTWRIVQENDRNPDKDVLLELWVFWFDDSHTGKVDSNESLRELDEAKVGSFTWENAYSKLQSPTVSPVTNSVQSDTATPVRVSTEYKMFIKSLRNLVDIQMKIQGAVPLGEFYIFPNKDELNSMIREESADTQIISSLCCTYNVYLANTNLLFQPNTRRIRLKSILSQPNKTRGKRAIISPSGESVVIASDHYQLSKQTEEDVLRQWSHLLDIPSTVLTGHDAFKAGYRPFLTAIKSTENNAVFYYPTILIFLSSDTKLSPVDMAGTHGLFKYNQGFSENLGDKWYRSAWKEKSLWNFMCPKEGAIHSVLDMLSQESSAVNQASFLQKAMHETHTQSPMTTTSMATPASTHLPRTDASTPSYDDPETRAKNPPQLSLAEFALAHFSLETHPEDIPDFPSYGTLVDPATPVPPTPAAVPVEPVRTETAPDQTSYPPPIDPFGLVHGVDEMLLDMPDRWNDDTMNDLENFDLGVTEEDFDFFETEPVLVKDELFINEAPLMLMETDELEGFDVLDKEVAMIEPAPILPDLFPPDRPSKPRDLFIPPTFAPVKVDFFVNDAKYLGGGKFTYPYVGQAMPLPNSYSPDYVPKSRTKKQRKKKAGKKAKASEETDLGGSSSDLLLVHEKSETALDREVLAESQLDALNGCAHNASHHGSNNDSKKSSNSSSSSSSSSSDEEDDSDDSSLVSTPSRVLDHVVLAQTRFIERMISSPFFRRAHPPADPSTFEYDSPFADAVADSYSQFSRPIHISTDEDYKVLGYLCQQAVLGGYPFSGGIESIFSHGIESSEGETTKSVIARRRNLLQKFHGDSIHTCSTPHDVESMNQNFKGLLNTIFAKNDPDVNAMCMEPPLLPAPVTVKGPLNVQQYYDLSETSQAHSKYGKYQVKRRRPAEPNLDTLRAPSILVNRQEEYIEGTPKLMMFWEKLRLEPYSCKKHIHYFIIYPENESIERNVAQFFKNLSTLYETCQLGLHHPGNAGSYRKGLVPVRLLATEEGESLEDQQMRSYQTECQQLGTAIGQMHSEGFHTVVYMVNPISDLASNMSMARCFNGLMESYEAVQRPKGIKPVVQLVPAEHVLRSASFGGCLKFGLKTIAFSVYSKCFAVVTRSRSNDETGESTATSEIYAPPFVLPRLVPNTVQYSIKKGPVPFPNILENQAVLHLGYCFSFDRRWMVVVWTDNHGELIEFATIDRQKHEQSTSKMFEEAWRQTQAIAKRTGFVWTFVISKLGLLFENELKVWLNCTGLEERIAVVCLDLESPLHISGLAPGQTVHTNETTAHSTMEGLNSNVPGLVMANHGASQSGIGKKTMHALDDHGMDQTKALLLNHRVAYSSKRERASLAMLNLDPSSSTENWMIPLASGYMIHTPSPTENTRHGLFHCHPPVIEIHLVFNQTHHSAYSTLRDIIQKFHALSYINIIASNSNRFPIHLALVERLSRLLLIVNPQ
ncbi:mediator complex subunit 13 C-terminal-domain-containing protein [Sporodiniella umbellata]|nr:mediator complex subunit 13 C-terminal-domain-containing protein [Sporodiniella umbellata]